MLIKIKGVLPGPGCGFENKALGKSLIYFTQCRLLTDFCDIISPRQSFSIKRISIKTNNLDAIFQHGKPDDIPIKSKQS